jgi:carbonic anhydrase
MSSEVPGTDPSDSKLTLPGQGLTKEEAFQRMLEGHWRYLRNERQDKTVTDEDRARHASGQFPFAAIIGCADSRVSPESIFDQEQGDLFVVRVAGHVIGPHEVASLEYSTHHLGTKLIVVMGHEKCGAVNAALTTEDSAGAIGGLLEEIRPACKAALDQPGDPLDNAVRNQVSLAVDNLLVRSTGIREAVESGEVRIIGLVYGLASGDLDILKTVG